MTPTDDELAEAYRERTRPESRDGCLGSEEIASLALDGTGSHGAVAHIGECVACADEVHAIRDAAPASVRSQQATSGTFFQGVAVAALLLLTIGLGGWSWVLLNRNRDLQVRLAAVPRERPEAGSRPAATIAPPAIPVAHVNVPIVDLEPPGAAARGESGAAAVVDLPPAAAYTLILNIDPQRQHEDYALEIVAEGGEKVWSARGVRRSARDTFTLTFERGLLGVGEFRVDLYAIDGETTTRLQSNTIRLPDR